METFRSEEFWVRTKWQTDDLNEKPVQFELTADDHKVSGIGVFRIAQRPSGEQHVDIVVTTAPSYWERVDRIYTLKQVHADRIQRHDDPSVAEFQCIA